MRSIAMPQRQRHQRRALRLDQDALRERHAVAHRFASQPLCGRRCSVASELDELSSFRGLQDDRARCPAQRAREPRQPGSQLAQPFSVERGVGELGGCVDGALRLMRAPRHDAGCMASERSDATRAGNAIAKAVPRDPGKGRGQR